MYSSNNESVFVRLCNSDTFCWIVNIVFMFASNVLIFVVKKSEKVAASFCWYSNLLTFV